MAEEEKEHQVYLDSHNDIDWNKDYDLQLRTLLSNLDSQGAPEDKDLQPKHLSDIDKKRPHENSLEEAPIKPSPFEMYTDQYPAADLLQHDKVLNQIQFSP